MARIYTATINEKTPAYFTGRTAEVSRAHEELRAVSHVICHDFRAPLRHILGFTQLLHEKAYSDLDYTNRHYLDTILESAKNFRP